MSQTYKIMEILASGNWRGKHNSLSRGAVFASCQYNKLYGTGCRVLTPEVDYVE